MIDTEAKFKKFFAENAWDVFNRRDGGIAAIKKINFPHLAGQLSNGDRIVSINIDGGRRYPEILVGMNEKYDIDLRDFEDVGIAIETLIKKGY